MTDEQLKEIRKRCEAATPGPWQCFEYNGLMLAGNEELLSGCGGCDVSMINYEDGKFTAHARTDIPALLAHIEHQRRAMRLIAATCAVIMRDYASIPIPPGIIDDVIQTALTDTKEKP